MAGVLRPPVPVRAPVPPGPVLSLVDSSPFGDLGDGDEWTGGFAYEPENHDAGELRDVCDGTSVDLPALAAPLGVVATPSNAGGTLTNAGSPYEYIVTASDANGETIGSTPVTTTIVSGTTGSVHVTWPAVEFATSYSVYGRKAGSIGLLAAGLTAEAYTDTGAATPGAPVPVTNTTGGPGTYFPLAIVTYYPWLAITEDACSTWGFSEHDFKGRALRTLEQAAKWQIGREFWEGRRAIAGSYPNNYLTNAADPAFVDLTPGGGPPSVARGQQILEDYLQAQGFGGQGMIHVQAQSAPNLLSARLVDGPRPNTQQLLSVLGNVIVPDAGYSGLGPNNAAPAAGTAWMYATDMVEVRIDDESNAKVFPDTMAEALDRSVNLLRFRAEKFVAASWDGFAHAAVRVTLAT